MYYIIVNFLFIFNKICHNDTKKRIKHKKGSLFYKQTLFLVLFL